MLRMYVVRCCMMRLFESLSALWHRRAGTGAPPVRDGVPLVPFGFMAQKGGHGGTAPTSAAPR